MICVLHLADLAAHYWRVGRPTASHFRSRDFVGRYVVADGADLGERSRRLRGGRASGWARAWAE